jgi:trafficking protein particle complex subunit 3
MASKVPSNNMNVAQTGTMLWQKQSKCNAEFFALTYGALVAELLRDLEDPVAINMELDRMGHSIGIRCIEEVLAKLSSLSSAASSSLLSSTKSFPETAELMQTAFRMFLGLATETKATSDTAYSISFAENPLAIFVELPSDLGGGNSSSDGKPQLEYSQLLAGMVRGMLEMLQYDVSSRIVQSVLAGGETNEIAVELKQILQEGAGEDYQEE